MTVEVTGPNGTRPKGSRLGFTPGIGLAERPGGCDRAAQGFATFDGFRRAVLCEAESAARPMAHPRPRTACGIV